MPPTDDKSRFVAIKLGLPMCKGCFFTPHQSKRAVADARWENGTAHHVEHPPDFLEPAGADLLLRTLLDKGWQITAIFKVVASIHVFLANPDGEVEEGIGTTWPEALLDAAFKALEEK